MSTLIHPVTVVTDLRHRHGNGQCIGIYFATVFRDCAVAGGGMLLTICAAARPDCTECIIVLRLYGIWLYGCILYGCIVYGCIVYGCMAVHCMAL